jgi:hypothetical protein
LAVTFALLDCELFAVEFELRAAVFEGWPPPHAAGRAQAASAVKRRSFRIVE